MRLPVKTNTVSLNIGIQHFISPQTISSYLGKIILGFGCNILVFQCICPPGSSRVFRMFYCFSTYFNSLDLSLTFSWAYLSVPIHFQPRVHRDSCVPTTFDLGTIYQGQSSVTGDIEEITDPKIQQVEQHPASSWMSLTSSPRRCSREINRVFNRKVKTFKRISTIFKHFFYILVFIAYISDIQLR